MPTTTTTRAATLPQTPPKAAAEVVGAQLAAYVAETRALDEDEWGRPTDCAGWDVRHIAAHVAGALDEGAHLTVLLRHLRAARRRPPQTAMVDALNDAQLADRVDVPGPRIVDEIERLAPKAVRMRLRTPGVVRRRPVPGDDLPPGSDFGYLFDVIYARDVWMHRIDTARATGRAMTPADGESEVVTQVVRDLAQSWQGPPFALELSGPVGGGWVVGDGAPVATVSTDTVEYFRLLSGRPADPEVAVDGEPGVAPLVRSARVAF